MLLAVIGCLFGLYVNSVVRACLHGLFLFDLFVLGCLLIWYAWLLLDGYLVEFGWFVIDSCCLAVVCGLGCCGSCVGYWLSVFVWRTRWLEVVAFIVAC